MSSLVPDMRNTYHTPKSRKDSMMQLYGGSIMFDCHLLAWIAKQVSALQNDCILYIGIPETISP